jgi:hypothetical protein
MAKIFFWVTAGADQEAKVQANLRLALRLKTVRGQDVRVYFFGPGVRLAESGSEAVRSLIRDLHNEGITIEACPANVEQMQLDAAAITGLGIELHPAGEVLVSAIEDGYQVIGV